MYLLGDGDRVISRRNEGLRARGAVKKEEE